MSSPATLAITLVLLGAITCFIAPVKLRMFDNNPGTRDICTLFGVIFGSVNFQGVVWVFKMGVEFLGSVNLTVSL